MKRGGKEADRECIQQTKTQKVKVRDADSQGEGKKEREKQTQRYKRILVEKDIHKETLSYTKKHRDREIQRKRRRTDKNRKIQ
jgi:hypothetical protein